MKAVGILAAGLVGLFAACEASASKGSASGEPDVLLVLGCRVRGEEAEETLAMRIERAAEFLRENKNTIAVACGGIVHKDQYKSEAQVIYDGLVERGIEKERIVLEDKSRTTAQNFINAKKLLNLDERRVAFLSSEFHLMRASMIAKRCSVKAETVAAPSPKRLLFKNYLREFWAIPLIIKDTKKE